MKRGISLIVLVVTILVLSILATVVIVNLSNTNIIGTASEAKYKTLVSSTKETLENAKAENVYLNGNIDYQTLLPEELKGEFRVNTNGNLEYVGSNNPMTKKIAEETGVTIINDSVKEIEDKYGELLTLAKKYVADGNSSVAPNLLLLQYVRRNKYNSSNWKSVAGEIDTNFVTYVDANKTKSLDIAEIEDPVTGKKVDWVHAMASLNAYLNQKNRDSVMQDYACWAGDIAQVIAELCIYKQENADVTTSELNEKAITMIGAEDNSSTFGISDMLGDADATNIYMLIESDDNIVEDIYNYYYGKNSDKSKRRYNSFYDYFVEWRKKYPDTYCAQDSDVVRGVARELLTTRGTYAGLGASLVLAQNSSIKGSTITIGVQTAACSAFNDYVLKNMLK